MRLVILVLNNNHMKTYHDWNNAIINYITRGLGLGARVFLSIDDETLEAIGGGFGIERPNEGWSRDFIRCVRSMCVHNDRVRLSRFTNPSMRDSHDRPRYVAFLAALVLAAHHMGDEHEDSPVDPKDFFTHFNKLLGLSEQRGRPKGLDSSQDEALWLDWSSWLRSQGFLPTARGGDGAYKYVNYPISQALLRQSDKNRLWRHFAAAKWQKNYDEVLLMRRVGRDVQYLTTHLQELLNPKGDMWLWSYDAISSACYEVYEEWRESGGTEIRLSGLKTRTSLDGRVYRSEDFFSGTVRYQIFPRQIRQSAVDELYVEHGGETYQLIEDRPGWYMPLWELDVDQLENGIKSPIQSLGSDIKNLYLPQRDFWILTLDPDTPESGIYASWDKGVELGTEFILLIKEQLRSDLNTFRQEGLLEWQSVNEVFDGWYEYVGTTILSEPEAWATLNTGNETLRLTLQPRTTFSINLTGGLRAPRGHGWFINHPPQISVAAFLPDVHLSVLDETDELILSTNVEAGKVVDVTFPRQGSYRIVVDQGGQADEKLIRVLDWTGIEPCLMDFKQVAQDLNREVYGAWVRD